ncbi:MAG: peptidoglycan DD-metalloendopeptidase family protein [Bacteroidales bacterium]
MPVLLLSIYCFELTGQNTPVKIGQNTLFMEGHMEPYPVYTIEPHHAGQWEAIKSLATERKILYLEQSSNSLTDKKLKLALPLKLKKGLQPEGFYTITSYIDHDSLFPDQLLDYNCGQITYDTDDGYNHTGTDFFPWPFPWSKMYNDEVEVVAAAPGILLLKQDGHFDQNCEDNNEIGNYIAIMHEDGSSAWYFHLKKNSLTQKSVGDQIETGEYLGVIGSSGISVAPHLHFEVYDSDINLIDPFYGSCNSGISESWWENQLPYKEPGINKLCTNAHLPFFPECPGEEISNEASVFAPGDTVFLMSYFKNISLNDTVKVSVFLPDGSLFSSWLWKSPWEFYTASWLYFYIIIEENIYGMWDYQLNYKDITYECNFTLKDPMSIENKGMQNAFRVYPNPTNDYALVESDQMIGKEVEISITNTYGHEYQSFQSVITPDNPLKINLETFNPGIYFIKLKSGEQFHVAKILKH